MNRRNRMCLSFEAMSENVAIARMGVGIFAAQLPFTLSDIEEVKIAVSEAVSNALIHGYENGQGWVEVDASIDGDTLDVQVKDHGKGIADVTQARQASYSSDPERMGLGFVFMETFMDHLQVHSEVNVGTTIQMRRSSNPSLVASDERESSSSEV